jgi:predicted dehydrogenase
MKRAIMSLLTFENGVIATLENSWGPDYGGAAQQSTASFRAQGTKGFVEVENLHQGVMIEHAGGVAFPDTVYMLNSYGRVTDADQIFYFINCIRLGTPSEVQLQDGLKSAIVAEAILGSLNSAGSAALSV